MVEEEKDIETAKSKMTKAKSSYRHTLHIMRF